MSDKLQPPETSSTRLLQEIVDQALLMSRIPGSLEPTSGGIEPSRQLSELLTAGLDALYEATGSGTSVEAWLASALAVDDVNQLAARGPLALANMLNGAAFRPKRKVTPMSDQEDEIDARTALLAMEKFGVIPDNKEEGGRP
ncbi:hypothetical protein [Azospirillum canadense]|uniref:hypothetical protein n=1 Tax=Azospirillum canadense TaxID=403962 RepID=UPI002227400F|nr:hypothetical protein [Azospirillum canadense]MCW2240698.1 hypothetical protein [Azospirillum canadense]